MFFLIFTYVKMKDTLNKWLNWTGLISFTSVSTDQANSPFKNIVECSLISTGGFHKPIYAQHQALMVCAVLLGLKKLLISLAKGVKWLCTQLKTFMKSTPGYTLISSLRYHVDIEVTSDLVLMPQDFKYFCLGPILCKNLSL